MFGASPTTASMRSWSSSACRIRPSCSLAEERALREQDRHTARGHCHRGHHVLDPGVVAIAFGGQPKRGTPPGIGFPHLAPPLLERERWIGDHAIEGGKPTGARIGEGRAAERVFAHNLEVLDAVED